jgi:hypothetical protein
VLELRVGEFNIEIKFPVNWEAILGRELQRVVYYTKAHPDDATVQHKNGRSGICCRVICF